MATEPQTAELRLEPWAVRVDHILDWQGRTRIWLATKLGIDHAQFHRLMHGQGGLILHPKHKHTIAEILGVPPGVIFEEGIAGVLLRLGGIQQLMMRVEMALDHEYSDGTVKNHRVRLRALLAAYRLEIEEEKVELSEVETRRLQAIAKELETASG